MDIHHTAHNLSTFPTTDMSMGWEDCDTLINDATNQSRQFGLVTPVNSSMMDDNGVSLNMYQGHLDQHISHNNLQHQEQQNLSMAQPLHNTVMPPAAGDNMGSLSPASASSRTTAMNMQNRSPSYSSPMLSDIQIKVDPYLNDGIQPLHTHSEHDYLYNSVPPNSHVYSAQPQEQLPNISPPASRAAPKKAKRRNNAQSDTQIKGDSDENASRSGDSNSNEEEDIMVKRKAQNRAAQRAFRERKEQRVRELEQKLGESEKEKVRLASENERLKKENTVISTENQVLMATTEKGGFSREPSGPLRANFPVHKFTNMLLADHSASEGNATSQNDFGPSYVVYEKRAGDVMLGAGAVWEQIMQEPDSDEIDIERVMEFLMGKERCDGFGPVFSLNDVKAGIAHARAIYS